MAQTTVTRWLSHHRTEDRHLPTTRDAMERDLTSRESEAVDRLGEGLEMKEIAREMGIGYQTVKMHLYSAKAKLGVRNLIELALVRHGHTPRSLRKAG